MATRDGLEFAFAFNFPTNTNVDFSEPSTVILYGIKLKVRARAGLHALTLGCIRLQSMQLELCISRYMPALTVLIAFAFVHGRRSFSY